MGTWDDCDAVERHPDVMSGAWVFRGTRVPVAALFENLREGATIEAFLECFRGVERSQVEAVLDREADAAGITADNAHRVLVEGSGGVRHPATAPDGWTLECMVYPGGPGEIAVSVLRREGGLSQSGAHMPLRR